MVVQNTERKLATIVSIDAAGYSRQSEIDETAAVQEVRALRARLNASAEAHGGRMFSSAGDGFMLEFTSVSGAIAFIDEVLATGRLPLRAGVHIDEVTATPDGDLLGRGVNIAARLRALAGTGEAIVSGEVKRVLPPAVATRLISRGTPKLAKMEERVDAFALARPWKSQSFLDLRGVGKRTLAALTLGGVVIAGLVFMMFAPQRQAVSETAAIMVLPFASLNTGDEDRFFAESISSSIATALARAGMSVVSTRGGDRREAQRNASVRFVVDGDVRREGDKVRVAVRVEDARTNIAVLSESFEAGAAEASAMPDHIAVWIASYSQIMQQAVAGGADARLAQEFIEILNLIDRREWIVAHDRARAVARAHPNNAMAQNLLAATTGWAYSVLPAQDFPTAIGEALAADDRSHALDPQNGEFYSARPFLISRTNWVERERLLRHGLELQPDAPSVPFVLGRLMLSVGRASDAEPLLRSAVARDPFNSYAAAQLFRAMVGVGDRDAAADLLSRATRTWPDDAHIIEARFEAASLLGSPSEASLLMADQSVARAIEPRGDVVRVVVRALASRSPRELETMRQACIAPQRYLGSSAAQGGNAREICLMGLSASGRLDEAFALAARIYPAQPAGARSEGASMYPLYSPELAAMRADARFVQIAERTRLLAYWRETGRSPDFCSRERAPVCNAARRS